MKNDVNEVKLSSIDQIIGQNSVKNQVKVALDATRFSEGKFENTMFLGPPGLGKTALANAIADELGVGFHEVLGQSVKTAADMNFLLLKAKQDGEIIFFDECHLLSKEFQTQLLMAIDKRCIIVQAGKKLVTLPLTNITYFFGTTNSEGIIRPLVDRCRMILHYSFYESEELSQIVEARCKSLDWKFEPKILEEIALRSRGTPRIALRLLQAGRRVALSERNTMIRLRHVQKAFELAEIDSIGLDKMESKYLQLLKDGPLRINVIASMLGVLDQRIVSNTIEPFLLRAGLIVKDDSGKRVLTQQGQNHIRG